MVALERLSLAVEEGELVTILGPSGSGKSTALRVVAGLEEASAGSVTIDGRDVTHVDAPDRGVSMVFQSFALFPHLTVEQNVGFGLQARGVRPAEIHRRVRETVAWLDLAGVLRRKPAELSGGERQRVALARSLVGRPRVLLMDEPLSNLDAKLRTETRAEIKRLQREAGITVVYVTHDQAEALSLGDRIGIMDGGVLQQYGRPRDVYERPANRFVAGFLGSPPMNVVPARVEDGAVREWGLHLPLPEGPGPANGSEVLAGFRPEHARVGRRPRGGFRAVLEVSEMAGHDRVWHVKAGAHRLAVRPPHDFDADEGEVVGVAVHAEDVRLFDPETGEAL